MRRESPPFDGKTTRRTGKRRIIYLTATLLGPCRRLVAMHPSGPILRNTDGDPSTTHAIRCRFCSLRAKLKLSGVTAYTWRHSWTMDALKRSVPIATVAEWIGHADTRMVSAYYSKLHKRWEYLRKAAGSTRKF